MCLISDTNIISGNSHLEIICSIKLQLFNKVLLAARKVAQLVNLTSEQSSRDLLAPAWLVYFQFPVLSTQCAFPFSVQQSQPPLDVWITCVKIMYKIESRSFQDAIKVEAVMFWRSRRQMRNKESTLPDLIAECLKGVHKKF